jgi:hypothetical protein
LLASAAENILEILFTKFWAAEETKEGREET